MRREFSKSVRLQAWQRCGGKCEGCTVRLSVGHFHYDHILSDAMGGEPVIENCAVLCTACHSAKTGRQDIPTIARSNRVRAKHLGLKEKKGPPIPGSRRSKWKRKLDGTVVPR